MGINPIKPLNKINLKVSGCSKNSEMGLFKDSVFIHEAIMEMIAQKTPTLFFKWLNSNRKITSITRIMVAFCIRMKCFRNGGFFFNSA
jgi:hypothetical protein